MNIIKRCYNKVVTKIKQLRGKPKYIARGMAAGVFVGSTPIIPFHTIGSISLAFLVKGSKAAAVVGSFFSNPVTIPIFYIGDYQIGAYLLERFTDFDPHFETVPRLIKNMSMVELMRQGADIFTAMLLGGVVVGIFLAIITYFITCYIFTKTQIRENSKNI